MEHDPFDLVGDVLEGQFRVLEVAGEGDLSVVYKGHHEGVDAPVAIKCLNLPPTLDPALVVPLVEDFREASRVHYRLAQGNLNIAQSLASGTTLAPRTGSSVPYLVREWFEGESLRSDLRRRAGQGKKGRSLDDAIRLLEPAVEGVAYAHTLGVVHLSLHPSNLFISKRGAQRTLKVLDFGVARTMNELAAGLPAEARPTKGLRVLFPGYAAPEQLDQSLGALGPATDVYALAVVIMEVLSDRPVISSQETGAMVARVLDKEVRPTPRSHGLLQLPKGVEAALARAVSLDPVRRQKNVATFWNELRASHKATARAATSSSSPPPPPSDDAGVEAALAVLTEHRPRASTLLGLAPAPEPVQPPAAPAPVPKEKLDDEADELANGWGEASVFPEPVPRPPASVAPAPVPATPPLPVLALTPAIERVHATTPAAAPVAPLTSSPAPAPSPPLVAAPARPSARLPPAARAFLASLSRVPRKLLVTVGVAATAAFVVLIAVVVAIVRDLTRPAAGGPSLAASAAAEAPSASASASAVASAPEPPASAEQVPRFSAPAARRALDATSRDVLHCRKTKVWGTGAAKVTFANDGSVSRVAIGPPFKGTPTAACVSDALSTAHVAPFSGKAAQLDYQFFVKEPPAP